MKQSKLILVFSVIVIFIVSNGFAQTFTGDVTLVTQTDLNNFGAMNYKTIDGELKIDEGIPGDITDLTPLSTIEVITSNLRIVTNKQLISFTGLNNLQTVGAELNIQSNESLQNIDALANLTSIGDDLSVRTNQSLTNLDGFIGVTSVGETILISTNNSLADIDGLSNIVTLGNALDIENNPILTNINGLSGITSTGGFLDIEDNLLITNLDALINITSVGGSLNIDGNFTLTNLDGLSNISSVGFGLLVRNNSALNSFCGLFSLLNGNGLGGSYNVGNNLVNPTEADVITGGACTPLPVELTAFTANIQNNSVHLNWNTATEVNNYGFEIERQKSETSSSISEWSKIGFINGHGNSNSPKYYNFIDDKIKFGEYYYRLKQVDIDGAYEYSVIVDVDLGLPSEFALSQNYPNPFNPTTIISYSIPNVASDLSLRNVQLTIFDVLGKEIVTLVNQQQAAGNYKIEFDASNLSSGLYFYTLKLSNFVETKKMLLMK